MAEGEGGGGDRWGSQEWTCALSLQDPNYLPCPPALLHLPDPLIYGLGGQVYGVRSKLLCETCIFLSFLPLEIPATIPGGSLGACSLGSSGCSSTHGAGRARTETVGEPGRLALEPAPPFLLGFILETNSMF